MIILNPPDAFLKINLELTKPILLALTAAPFCRNFLIPY
jgi:hypothetical protein